MRSVLVAPLAVFLQFQAVLERLLVLCGMIVDPVTVCAFQADEVFLGHEGSDE